MANIAAQPGFLVSLAGGEHVRFDAFFGPAFRDDPATRLARGDQQNLLLSILVNGQRQSGVLLTWLFLDNQTHLDCLKELRSLVKRRIFKQRLLLH